MHVNACIWACMRASASMCTHMRSYACNCMNMQTNARICTHEHAYACGHMLMRVYSCILMHSRVHARICVHMLARACCCHSAHISDVELTLRPSFSPRLLLSMATWAMPPPVSPSDPFGGIPSSAELGVESALQAGCTASTLCIRRVGVVDGTDCGLGLFASASSAALITAG